MTKQEEILEGLKELHCNRAKSDGMFACKTCEQMELKHHCSMRNDVIDDLLYLNSQGAVIKVTDTKKHFGKALENQKLLISLGYTKTEPLVKE